MQSFFHFMYTLNLFILIYFSNLSFLLQEAFKLRLINLQHFCDPTWIPNPLTIPNLDRINFLNCNNLPYIPLRVQHFNNLSVLHLDLCKSLRCFLENIHFRSLITLIVSYCINFTQFSQIYRNIKRLK